MSEEIATLYNLPVYRLERRAMSEIEKTKETEWIYTFSFLK